MGAIEAELAALRITVNGLTETVANLSVRLAGTERRLEDAECKLPVEGGELVYSRPAEYRTPPFVNVKVTRDDVIERAKGDVAKLTANHRRMTTGLVSYDYEFIVNHDKRAVVALLKGSTSKRVYYRGKSRCAPGDVFNSHIGRAIALRRALGLEVPDEYVNSPAPTEVRVGDIVTNSRDTGPVHAINPKKKTAGAYEIGHNLPDGDGLTFMTTLRDKPYEYWARTKNVRIIDDSREEVSV